MDSTIIVGFSIILQITAALLALRLIPITGERRAWMLISAALCLMAVRRCITLLSSLTGKSFPFPGSTEDSVTLAISALMVLGIAWIAPLFHSIRRFSESLRESEEKYRTLFEDSRDAIYIGDSEGILLDVNQATLDLFGYSREEMIGMDARRLYGDLTERNNLRDELKHKGYVRDFEITLCKKDGTPMDCLITSTTQRSGAGAILGYRGIVRDVSARKQAEQALAESEAKFRSLAETAASAIVIYQDDKLLYVNPATESITGYTKEDLRTMDFRQILHPDFQDTAKELELAKRPGEAVPTRCEFKILMKGGEERWLDGAAVCLEFEGHTASLATLLDTTERKRSEQERACLVAAIEQAAEGILIMNTSEVTTYVNPAFERISGYGREDLVGRHSRAFRGNDQNKLFFKGLHTCLTVGEVWSGRFTSIKKDGASYEVEATISPVRNSLGDIVSCVAIERDVTREMRLEKQLRQTRKMEAIGTLAGGIAHDFNNILGIITGFVSLAMYQAPEASSFRSYMENALNGCERAKNLVAQIVAFSRQGEQERKPVEMERIVIEVLNLLRASLPATIEIHKDISVSGMVMADPTQIHQVLMNLCTNAAHAMEDHGGTLEVRLRDVEIDEGLTARHPELRAGSYLRLTVSDSGHGMDAAVMERIFDPYFTTKAPGKGTGLGLSVVHGIVRSHGGAITAYSEPGKGSTFNVFLPKFAGDALDVAPSTATNGMPVPTGNECILFVDDEEALRESGKNMLELLGYEAVVRSSAVEALEAFRAQPHRFDMVITDLTMPKMTGFELTAALRRIRPNIPLILCTGFSDLITPQKAKSMGIGKYLLKPLTLRDLATSVREVLDCIGLPRNKSGNPNS